MVTKILIISLIVCTVNAATWRGKLPEKPPGFEGKIGCYIKEINDVVAFGIVVWPLGHCYRVTCGEELLHYASCGVVGTSDKNCHVTEIDKNKPYPECCPKIVCTSENEID